MKKSLFKLILGVFATVLLFTSCLGDSNSSSENPNAFAYITTIDGKQCAAIGGVYFWSPRIATLSQGRCYILSYRTNYEAYSSKILLAEDIAEPILLTTTYSRIEPPTIEDTFNPISFAPYYGSSNSFYGDNWGFAYTAKLRDNDTPDAYFFYDSNRQYEMVDGVRQDVKKNQMIIDVRFNYTPGADGGTVLKRQCLSVGNLSQIRQEYKIKNSDNFEFGSDGYISVAIKFRYNQLQSDDTTVKPDVYVGDWNSSLYNLLYYKTDL